MARAFGRILNTIWDDPDFLALTASEQRTYLFLISQPNISWSGLLPLTLRRWGAKARGLTAQQILTDLRGLDEARFVALDEDTEEVLVRSLMRRDEVWKMPRILGSAVANAVGISSRKIRRILLAELDRIPITELSGDQTEGRDGRLYPSVRSQVIGHIETLRNAWGSLDTVTQTEPVPEEVPEPVPEGDPGGFVVRAGARVAPISYLLSPKNPSASAARNAGADATQVAPQPDPADEPAPRPRAKRAPIEQPQAWERFWRLYPRKKDKGTAERAWNKALRGGTPVQTILDGLEFYVLDCRGREAKYIKYPATWLNARGWQDEPDPQPKAPSPIGAPSEAAAMQPPPFAAMRHEFQRHTPGAPDFGDPYRLPD